MSGLAFRAWERAPFMTTTHGQHRPNLYRVGREVPIMHHGLSGYANFNDSILWRPAVQIAGLWTAAVI